MTFAYEKPPAPVSGLRLHMNENTSGCSPAVLQALGQLTVEKLAFYPDYSEPVRALAEYLRVSETNVALTNGLDEGILAASIAAARAGESPGEAIIVVPAFEMQPAFADAAGLRIVEVPLGSGFEFPANEVLSEIRAATRIVFITTPHNPTGQIAPRESIVEIARRASGAMVFVDEAYADFSDTSMIDQQTFAALPNVVVGRTFAKAYGLAALRCGALVGASELLEPIRRVLPPYNVNIAAAVALPAALRDRDRYVWYLEQVRRSKHLLYEGLDRLGIVHWKSAGNFVLARIGPAASRVCGDLTKRDIHIRDRSSVAGCEGCVRITAGVVEHTARCLAALEEALCGAQ